MAGRRRAVLALCTALVTVAAAELLLLAAELASERVAAVLRGNALALPDPRLGSRPNPALEEHDGAGWRNALRPQRTYAVAIGDSQTYGEEVPREGAWPQRLAALSGRSFYNMALGGYGPVEYERLLDEALALSPELVLVGLYAGNDLADAYMSVYPRALAPELRSQDAGLVQRCLALDAQSELKAKWEQTRDARKGRKHPRLERALDRVAQASRLFALWSAGQRALSPPQPRHADYRPEDQGELRQRAAEAGRDLLMPYDAGPLSTVFTPAARLAALDTGDARVAEGLRIALEALARMQQRCAGRCRLVVVAIPSKELVFARSVIGAGGSLPRTYAETVLREALLWERVQRALAAAGIPLVDSLPRLRAALDSGRNPYRGDWDGHPIAAGNDAIAEAVLASGVLSAAQPPQNPALP